MEYALSEGIIDVQYLVKRIACCASTNDTSHILGRERSPMVACQTSFTTEIKPNQSKSKNESRLMERKQISSLRCPLL